MPPPSPPCASLDAPKPWHHYLTLDLLVLVLQRSLLHPFIAWLIPLCLRALATSLHHPVMHLAVFYASCITLLALLSLLNTRIAHGPARPIDLDNEVILITGGASGLGLLLAEVYGLRGVSVAVLDVQPLDGDSRGVNFYQCDVSDLAQVEAVAEKIRAELGTPTVIVNNAAVAHGKSLLELSAADIEQTIRTNLLSHFHTIKTFLPGILASPTGGTIITVSSVLGHVPPARNTAYAASKAGVSALHAALTAELAQHPQGGKVKTILVTPGQMATGLFEGVQTPSRFLAPVVEPVEVVRRLVRLIDGGLGGEVRCPSYVGAVGWWAVLPGGLQRLARWATGVDGAMGTFRGNTGQGKKER